MTTVRIYNDYPAPVLVVFQPLPGGRPVTATVPAFVQGMSVTIPDGQVRTVLVPGGGIRPWWARWGPMEGNLFGVYSLSVGPNSVGYEAVTGRVPPMMVKRSAVLPSAAPMSAPRRPGLRGFGQADPSPAMRTMGMFSSPLATAAVGLGVLGVLWWMGKEERRGMRSNRRKRK